MSSHPAPKLSRHQVSASQPHAFASSSFTARPGSPISISSRSERSPMAEDYALLWTSEELTQRRQVISINILPDGALLAIFDYYMFDIRIEGSQKDVQMAWLSLVHVCHRWRSIVFESPRRLDLRLVCTGRTPTRDRLDVWPTLPLVILGRHDSIDMVTLDRRPIPSTRRVDNVDDIVAALERTDRVCQIHLGDFWNPDMEIFLAAMRQPFPKLTHLQLLSIDRTVAIPDLFLGGSAPRLEHFSLYFIPFPALPKLLLSATHLRRLELHDIPHSGYFPPDAIATVLTTLTSLNYFQLEFKDPRSRPDQSRRPSSSTRSVLPVLTYLRFKGVFEYLEDLVACIDAPQLNTLHINFFNDIEFDAPQLLQFISHAPKFQTLKNAAVDLMRYTACVNFFLETSPRRFGDDNLRVKIRCRGLDWQVSSIEQVCTLCLPHLPVLENLYVSEEPLSYWEGTIDNEQWLQLLHPFSAVKNLYLSEPVALRIVSALLELVEGRATEVLPTILPTLQNIFLRGPESSGPIQKCIGKFVAARQVAGHPIAVSQCTDKQDETWPPTVPFITLL